MSNYCLMHAYIGTVVRNMLSMAITFTYLSLGLIPFRANAAVELYDVAIVEVAGRPGHQGLFPVQSLPIQGANAIVRSRLIGTASNVTLNVHDVSGNLLSQIPMLVPSPNQAVAGTFFADFVIPAVPFTLSISGVDAASGSTFDLSPPVSLPIQPTTIGIRLIPTISEPSPELPFLVSVQITNYGPDDTFTVALTSDVGGSVSPPSTDLTLSKNASTAVQFQFTLPTITPTPVVNMLTLTATVSSATRNGTGNEANLRMLVSLVPQSRLIAWIDESSRVLQPHDTRPTVVWVCDARIEQQTIVFANDLVPVKVESISPSHDKPDAGEGHDKAPLDSEGDFCGSNGYFPKTNCESPTLLRAEFETQSIISQIATNSFPSRSCHHQQQVSLPITAYAVDGTRLIGYAALQVQPNNNSREK